MNVDPRMKKADLENILEGIDNLLLALSVEAKNGMVLNWKPKTI